MMELKRADNHWTATAKIASTPFAQEVWTLMKEGVVRGVSVGFQPTESRPPSKKDLDMFGDQVRRLGMASTGRQVLPQPRGQPSHWWRRRRLGGLGQDREHDGRCTRNSLIRHGSRPPADGRHGSESHKESLH
jgi:hypothetical protein